MHTHNTTAIQVSKQSKVRKFNFQKQPSEVVYKKGVLKNIANFTWKTRVGVSYLLNFIKKRLKHRCFPMKFAKFLRTPILKKICERLLLNFAFLIKPKTCALFKKKKWYQFARPFWILNNSPWSPYNLHDTRPSVSLFYMVSYIHRQTIAKVTSYYFITSSSLNPLSTDVPIK